MLAWWKTGGAATDGQACLPGAKKSLAPVYGDPELYSVNTGPGVIKQSDAATRPQLEAFGDFSLEVKVMVTETSARDATAGIYFNRKDEEDVYHLGIFPNEDRWKVYEGANRLLVEDGHYKQGLDQNRWHTLRVDVRDRQAHASIDGIEVTAEPVPLMSDGGGIGIRMRDSAASFDDLVLFDAEGNAVFTDDFSAGLDGWTTENESLWYVQEDEGNRYVSGDVLVDVETLLSPEFSPRLDPHFLMLEAAGAKNVRIFFFWDEIQSSGPDDYYWNNMDAMLITARDHGINVLVNIVYAPVWAIAPENRADAAAKAFPPVDVSDYGNFVAESVRRYKPGGVLAQEQGWDDDYGVTDFQIGHEYNAGRLSGYARTLFAGWMGDLDQYVDMLKEGHDAVKDGCPECVVISGPTTELLKPNYDTQLDPTGERQYLWQGVEDLYANIQARHPGDPNAADMYFDVLSLHV
jgi:hypothetical protein